jgi:hypothetical protein
MTDGLCTFVYKRQDLTRKQALAEEYPVLLLAGYANLPEDFDKDLPSFTQFLNRIRIGDRSGFDKLKLERATQTDPQTTFRTPVPSNPEHALTPADRRTPLPRRAAFESGSRRAREKRRSSARAALCRSRRACRR